MTTARKRPLVSVIAVSYNHERWLIETLKSVRDQSLKDFELIFVDDASTDRSTEIAIRWLEQEFRDARTIIHRQNRGLCRTLNEALQHCRGRYVQLVACDDVLRADKLERDVAVLECAGSRVALVHSRMSRIDASGEAIDGIVPVDNFWNQTTSQKDLFEQLVSGNCIATATVLLRADAIRSIGGYDERLSYEDLDMWLRLARSYSFVFADYVSVTYRVLSTGLHTKIGLADRYWILRKHAECPCTRPALMWAVYKLYERGGLPPDIRRDFLRCASMYPDMANARNMLIRMRVPSRLCRSLVQMKEALGA